MIIEKMKTILTICLNHSAMRFRHKKSFVFLVALAFLALIYQRNKRQKKLQQAVLARNNRCNVIRSPSILEGINALNEIESDVKKGNGKFIMLPNGRVHYRIEGSKSAPLLVMCHGFGVFSFVFEGIINHFIEAGYRVLVFDWYAHGFSEAPNPSDHKYSADLFVNQLNDLLSALRLNNKSFYLMGHSMGGLLAAIYASRYQHKIKKLILICPAG
jgi:predicted alpha/beta-fold hydrolase